MIFSGLHSPNNYRRNSKMKFNRLATISLLLWVATITVFAWFFIRGNTAAGTDGRTAIVLQAGERNFVLSEMRGLLSATQGIIEGINQGDMQRVIKSSRAAGMAGTAEVNPALMAKLPIGFKTLGIGVHRDMDEIAKAAEGGTPAPEILKMVSNTLTKCVACHSTWQLSTGK